MAARSTAPPPADPESGEDERSCKEQRREGREGLRTVFRPAPIEPPAVERGGGSEEFHAESPPVQPPGNAILRWPEVPGARSYNVTVLTQDLVVVHRSVGLSSHELRLPEAVGQRAAGTGLLWNVDAVLPDGRTVASPTFEVRLRDGR